MEKGKKMSKKIIFAWGLLLSFLLVIGLVSCKISHNSGDATQSPNVDDGVIYSPYVNASIVLGEGIDNSDIASVRNAYFKRVGKEIAVKSADTEATAHEIVIGKTDREISTKAYRRLVLSKTDDQMVGFSIYSDGKSVAIAFDEAVFGEDIAFIESLDYFISKYMTKSTLTLDVGDGYIANFDPIDRQKEKDAAEIERLWDLKYSQILAKVNNIEGIADAIVSELKSTYSIYSNSGDPVVWLANLYDPVSGGFYYSNSARDNIEFAADLDSTAQALGLIESILEGYDGTMTDYLGEEIAAKFVSFAKNMQDKNGYFYHPQWSRKLIDETPERKNIDVINALNILGVFGASPIYDTPNGVKGEGASSASALTLPFSENGVTAVSKILLLQDDQMYIPQYLKSAESFSDYLAAFDIKNDTVAVCKQLTSELPLYLAVDEKLAQEGADYRICELLKQYLAKSQGYNGLWSTAASYKTISELNGFLKIYNTINASIPRFESIVETILEIMRFETEPQTINDISEAWTALYLVMNNIKSFGYETSEIVAERCVSTVYGRVADLISLTSENLLLFLREHNSFSTTLVGSASESYGMPVAIPLTVEGDMNATLLATKNIWYSIFGVIGVGHVPVFKTSDRMMFQKTLLDMGIIIKNEVIKTPAEKFDDIDIGDEGPYTIGWRTSSNVTKYTEVVSVDEERGNALRFYASNKSPLVYLSMDSMSDVRSASCYSYEFDVLVNEEYSGGIGASIIIHPNMHVVALERVGDTVRILERSGKYDDAYTYDTGARAKVGEWFNLRVEYYPGTAETVRIKIYFNGECVSVSDLYCDKQSVNVVPSNEFAGVSIYNTSKSEVSLLLDNVLIESSYLTYKAETSSNLSYNVDSTSEKQKINDFDNSTEGSAPSGFIVSGNAADATVMTDQNSNKVFSVSEKAGEIILPLDQRGIGTNSALIEFDFMLDTNSAVGTKYQINFNEHLYKNRCFGAVQLAVMEENGGKYATIIEVTPDGKTSNVYSNIRISLGVKYTLRLHLFYKEGVMVVFIGDSNDNLDIVGINMNILKDSYKYYMGQATLEVMTPTLNSTILIDNLVAERIVSDYETATSPKIPRKEYTFDDAGDAGDMVISGVKVLDGELSFAGASSNAFVEIPINQRVNVPTLSVIKLDVRNIDGNSGEVVIKLTDKSGTVVAAISLVKQNGNIDIHEYTENRRYPTPIYTVTSNSFALTIKYSAQRGGYNIFINDTYVTSSSILYTADSKGIKFEKLNISSTGDVGLTIDNLYAEEVCSTLITSVSTSSGSDITDGALTYENNSFVAKPSSIQTSFPTSGPAINVREGVFESIIDGTVKKNVSKVLEYYSDGEASNLILFNRTHSLENANAAFFETDLMIRSTGGKMRTKFEFGGIVGGTYPLIYYLDFTTEGPGRTILLKTNDYEVTLDEKVTEGVWFKLRIEYTDTPYDYNYDGYNDCIVRVFINGVQIGEGKTANNASIVPSAVDMKRIRCVMYSGVEGSVFFDNTILGQCNMEYEAALPADTDVLYFNPDVVTHQTVFTFGKTTSTAQISKYPTPTDAANKVLEFYTSSGSADKLSIGVTKNDTTANAIMFETDIVIEPKSNTATFYLSPQTAKNKYPFRLTIEATKGGSVTISGDGIPKTVIGNSGELIHIKVEYMNPMVDYTGDNIYDILYKIYVGDSAEAIAIGYKPYNASSYYNPLDLTKYVFESPSESEATIYFDNVKFWQVTLTPDEAENAGNSNEGTLGGTVGGTHDNNAWT